MKPNDALFRCGLSSRPPPLFASFVIWFSLLDFGGFYPNIIASYFMRTLDVGATGTMQEGVGVAVAWGVRGALGGIRPWEVEEGARVGVTVEGEENTAGAGDAELCLALILSFIWIVSERLKTFPRQIRCGISYWSNVDWTGN